MGSGFFSSNKSHHSCASVHEPVLKDGVVQYDSEGVIRLQASYRGCSFSTKECAQDTCILGGPDMNGFYSCCCQGTLCNTNEVRQNTTMAPTATPTTTPTKGQFR